MRSFINKLLLGTLTVASVACTGDYLEINSNPYQPGDLSADDYALGSAMNNLASCVVSSDVNTAQFTDCLLGGPYGGYFADSNTSWSKTIANFNASDDWTRVFLKSDRIIPILYTNLTAIENLATQTGNQVPLAIAKIIKVAAMSRVTDAYGPIPYTEIGKQRFIKDAGTDIYIGSYPEGADIQFSRIKVFSWAFPVMFTHETKNDFSFSVGAIVNFNTHASLKTRYKLEGQEYKLTDNNIHQTPVTVDLQASISYKSVGFYVKYSPCKVLDTAYGPEFTALSVGLILF